MDCFVIIVDRRVRKSSRSLYRFPDDRHASFLRDPLDSAVGPRFSVPVDGPGFDHKTDGSLRRKGMRRGRQLVLGRRRRLSSPSAVALQGNKSEPRHRGVDLRPFRHKLQPSLRIRGHAASWPLCPFRRRRLLRGLVCNHLPGFPIPLTLVVVSRIWSYCRAVHRFLLCPPQGDILGPPLPSIPDVSFRGGNKVGIGNQR